VVKAAVRPRRFVNLPVSLAPQTLRQAWLAFLYVFVTGLVCLNPLVSSAQQPDQTVDAIRLEAARKLLAAMNASSGVKDAIATMIGAVEASSAKESQHSSPSVHRYFDELRIKLQQRDNELIELLAPYYAREFSVSELNELIAFYKSPIGQKLTSSQAELAKESAPVIKTWFAATTKQIERDMNDKK